jgi:hypothetical protein
LLKKDSAKKSDTNVRTGSVKPKGYFMVELELGLQPSTPGG